MNVEENRLNTFNEWPANAAVEAPRLARAGFYYTGRGQEVQCFLCGSKITSWDYGDSAIARHRNVAPDCPFVVKPSSTCNVPLVPTSSVPPVSETPAAAVTSSRSVDDDQASNVSENPSTDYRSYIQRLGTFNWCQLPKGMNPRQLAGTGCYYSSSTDEIRCFYCGGQAKVCQLGEASRQHGIHLPNCDFYVLQDENCVHMLIVPDGESGKVKMMPGTESDLSELGILLVNNPPIKPNYSTYEQRLSTFHNWPSDAKQSKEALANAGFYYEGYEDAVRCFHCDGGLRKWKETDNAWVEHAWWFQKCEFVALVRGQEFIRRCRENREHLDLSIFEGVREDEKEEEKPVFSEIEKSVPSEENKSAGSNSAEKSSTDTAAEKTSSEIIAFLQEQIRRMTEERLCKICMSKEVAIVVLPCGHISTCIYCTASLTHCPICRHQICATIRAFFS